MGRENVLSRFPKEEAFGGGQGAEEFEDFCCWIVNGEIDVVAGDDKECVG